MTDLRTSYLGFDLAHPLVPGASPLVDHLDGVRRLHDAGAPMLTLRSLIAGSLRATDESRLIDAHTEGVDRCSVYAGVHEAPVLATDAQLYCEHLQNVKQAVGAEVPVVASLYARDQEDWITNAHLLVNAGADALELNTYGLAIADDDTQRTTEERIVDMVQAVRREVTIPLAVKLLPTMRGFDQFARRMPAAGADALVLFNGFYRSDLGADALRDPFQQALASPLDPFYRLRWLARLSGGLAIDLAFSGGARTAQHAVKAVLCGAGIVQLVTVLLKKGPDHLSVMRDEMAHWMEQNHHKTLRELRGQVCVQAFDSLEGFEIAYNRQILVKPT